MKRTINFNGRASLPDPRDKRFELTARRNTKNARYWRDDYFRGDQGATPHCVGYAWAHWLANAPIRGQYLEPAGVYTCAQRFDEWRGESYEGTSVRAGCKVLRSLGFVERFEWATTVDQVATAVLSRGPVVIGSSWFEGMNATDDSGFVRVAGELLGGHAWIITGVNVARQRFRLLNSWGDAWGERGRAWISAADLAKLLDADGEACSAVEKRPKFRAVTLG